MTHSATDVWIVILVLGAGTRLSLDFLAAGAGGFTDLSGLVARLRKLGVVLLQGSLSFLLGDLSTLDATLDSVFALRQHFLELRNDVLRKK